MVVSGGVLLMLQKMRLQQLEKDRSFTLGTLPVRYGNCPWDLRVTSAKVADCNGVMMYNLKYETTYLWSISVSAATKHTCLTLWKKSKLSSWAWYSIPTKTDQFFWYNPNWLTLILSINTWTFHLWGEMKFVSKPGIGITWSNLFTWMFLQKTAFFWSATDVVSASGENSKLFFSCAATAWSFSPGFTSTMHHLQVKFWPNFYMLEEGKINDSKNLEEVPVMQLLYSYVSDIKTYVILCICMYIHVLHTPSPVFLELRMRFDPQQKKCKSTKHNKKHLSKVSGVDVFSVLFSCLIKLILKKYFSVVIIGNEGSLESNIYHITNQKLIRIHLVGKMNCSSFGNENIGVTSKFSWAHRAW